MAVPGFSEYSKEILTHAPAASITLVLALSYLRLTEHAETKFVEALGAGFLIAVGAALRPLSLWLCVPFVFLWLRRPRLLMAMILPILAQTVLTLLYQQSVFGDPFRTGYHYWVSDPYGDFFQTFSFRFLRANAPALAFDAGVVFYAVLIALPIAMRKSLPAPCGKLLLFASLALLPPSLVHLFYFYRSAVFFLPLAALLSVAAGICFVPLVSSRLSEGSRAWFFILVLAPLVALAFHLAVPPRTPWRRKVAEDLSRITPPNATIITAMDPAYLEPFVLRGTQRRLLPVARRVEYASKEITGVRRAQGCPAISVVAVEAFDQLEAEIGRGTPVYIETKFLKLQELELVKSHFRLHPVGEAISELALKE